MMTFDITGDQVAQLGDADLRELVARLCRAELQRAGLPISAVTAGGDQDASDGGIDVRVSLRSSGKRLDFIPRPETVFQVKRADMPRAEIRTEMRPGGKLRTAIAELARRKGAYVIVSSRGSVTDRPLQDRQQAMRDAVARQPKGKDLHLDFYDRMRLAAWINEFPGVALWLRERIGDTRGGWRPFGNWAAHDPVDSEYLLDDTPRLTSRGQDGRPLTAKDGIDAIRQKLAQPGGVVRLIGLSGTGKTRLVQALFDARIGSNALDPALAVYADQAQQPFPRPREMLDRLGALGTRSIVVIDNCNPEMHRALAESVALHKSTLSLVTVEYDVAGDEPEVTEVFDLTSASESVLERILERLAPHLSQPDRRRIAGSELSGGNARIALALARTVTSRESLGTLSDRELFRRLFHQRNSEGELLLRAAEALALVYSFNFDEVPGPHAELEVLRELTGISVADLRWATGQLKRRDLVQARGPWRAVLPHAIANGLARSALEGVTVALAWECFASADRERLFTSFSHRISFLHDCEPARTIAIAWLDACDPTRLSTEGMAIFSNFAQAAPSAAFRAIRGAAEASDETGFLAASGDHQWRWAHLLRALAYDDDSFRGAALLLARMRAREIVEKRSNSIDEHFSELFQILLSGTHATVATRIGVLRELAASEIEALRTTAFEGLHSMLKASEFHSSNTFTFGAHSRDYGWRPRTGAEAAAWYASALGLAGDLLKISGDAAQRVRGAIRSAFRSLWRENLVNDQLEQMLVDLSRDGYWPEAWRAVRHMIQLDVKHYPPDLAARSRQLEHTLRPTSLVDRIQAFVLIDAHGELDEDEEGEILEWTAEHFKGARERTMQRIRELGKEAAAHIDELGDMLTRLQTRRPGQQDWFGHGLAVGAPNPEHLWNDVRLAFGKVTSDERSTQLICGLVVGFAESGLSLVDKILDEAVTDPLLAAHFPSLQCSIPLDRAAISRLKQSLAQGSAAARQYSQVGYGFVDRIPPGDFAELIELIRRLPDGQQVAVDVLSSRLHDDVTAKRETKPAIVKTGRALLAAYSFTGRNDQQVFHLVMIARRCLRGANGIAPSRNMIAAIIAASEDEFSIFLSVGDLMACLFELQPETALDGFLDPATEDDHLPFWRYVRPRENSPLDKVPGATLLQWVSKDPARRGPLIARQVRAIAHGPDGLSFSPIALELLTTAQNQADILGAFDPQMMPSGGAGSLANLMRPYSDFAKKLLAHQNSLISAWAQVHVARLATRILDAEEDERITDDRFE